MRRRQPPVRLVLALALVLLGGCSFSSPKDLIDVTEVVSASALVQSNWYPGTGFLIDRDERLLLTTCVTAGHADEVQVVFPVVVDGKALVRKSAWVSHAKDRMVKARVLIADPQRDLAVLRLDSVPDDVPELKLAMVSPATASVVHFLGAGEKPSQVWAHASSSVQAVEPRSLPIEGQKKATNQVIQLDAGGALARGVAGGALLNESNEVVGIVANSQAQTGALLGIDVSEIRPVVAAVYRTFGMYAYDHREYDMALKYSDRALAVWPSDALGYNERGAAWSQKDQFAKAIGDYSKALELEPRLTVAYRNRGSAYYHLGKYKDAVADCSRALDQQPKYLSAYCIRREAYARLGMRKELQADNQIVALMTQPGWKTVSISGNSKYAASSDSDDGEGPGARRSITDANGRQFSQGKDGYWHGDDSKRYIVVGGGTAGGTAVGGYRPVMPGAGIPLR